jgi:predicted O-linked N-acetylglucosamine transferase (SPINDLY family)
MTPRNAPCHCGSGKKFKHCHGAAAARDDGSASFRQAGNSDRPVGLPIEDSINTFRQQVHSLISGRKPEQLQQALDCLTRWEQLQPHSFEVLQRQLEIHLHQGRLEEVRKSLQAWDGPRNQHPEFEYFSGVLAQLKGDIDAARRHYAVAISEQRSKAKLDALDEAAMNVATAIQLCETAAGNFPGSSNTAEEGMFGAAEELQLLELALLQWQDQTGPAEATAEIKRIHANAWYNLGCAALAGFTADDRRIGLFEKAIELDPGHLLAQFNHAFAHNYSYSKSAEQIFQTHKRAANWLESAHPPLRTRHAFNRKNQPRRIRLAYVSSDFRQHSVVHFILPVLAHHNRERFEVFAYHTHRRVDELTQRIRQHAEHFRHVANLSDDQLGNRILADEIDVLVDLNGLTNGHRLAMLTRRVAPLQLNWIGYPNTTGLAQMDFRVVDGLTDPPGQSEPFCSERLLRLHQPFLCFAVPEPVPPVSPAPCLRNGYITLGSFNALPKLNPPLLRHWAEIMQKLPGSRLMLKNFGMDFETPREQIRSLFAQQGIQQDRLLFAGKTASQTEHLQFYDQVDICLDSFPYNGTTTTCDSLLMGVPVVSRAGSEHRSRVGLSLLSAVGLESLVASDENSLRGIVTALAANPNELQNLRANLRSRLMQSPLTDAARLTANLEAEFLNAWQLSPANMGNT